jgi:hypothetical protein
LAIAVALLIGGGVGFGLKTAMVGGVLPSVADLGGLATGTDGDVAPEDGDDADRVAVHAWLDENWKEVRWWSSVDVPAYQTLNPRELAEIPVDDRHKFISPAYRVCRMKYRIHKQGSQVLKDELFTFRDGTIAGAHKFYWNGEFPD